MDKKGLQFFIEQVDHEVGDLKLSEVPLHDVFKIGWLKQTLAYERFKNQKKD